MEAQRSIDTNNVLFRGILLSDLEFDHNIDGEDFYSTRLSIQRQSGAEDIIPIIIPQRTVINQSFKQGDHIYIKGQVRSRHQTINGRRRLLLYIFTKKIMHHDPLLFEINQMNRSSITGYVCKKPVFRKTSNGKEITDLMIAVNQQSRSDYIPAIAWNDTAKFAATLCVGDQVHLYGRMQSRTYTIMDDVQTERTVYELSISNILPLVGNPIPENDTSFSAESAS